MNSKQQDQNPKTIQNKSWEYQPPLYASIEFKPWWMQMIVPSKANQSHWITKLTSSILWEVRWSKSQTIQKDQRGLFSAVIMVVWKKNAALCPNQCLVGTSCVFHHCRSRHLIPPNSCHGSNNHGPQWTLMSLPSYACHNKEGVLRPRRGYRISTTLLPPISTPSRHHDFS